MAQFVVGKSLKKNVKIFGSYIKLSYICTNQNKQTMTFEITPLQEAYGMLSDMHKDAYGFRPRGIYRDDLTIEEIHEELDSLEVIIMRNMKEELLQEEANRAEFEALITRTIGLGAGDRKTALRWLIEAEDESWDVEFFVWKQGLGCGKVAQPYVDEILPIVQEIFADKE